VGPPSPPREGAVVPRAGGGGGRSELFVLEDSELQGHIYLNEIWAQDKIYILVCTLLG
jgi:hypothetical protein